MEKIQMRLWSKELLHVLPRQQLVSQWRELSLAAKNIQEKGTPNHILINKIMDYPLDHFVSYSLLVRNIMSSRNYRTMDSVWNKIVNVCPDWKLISMDELYPEWMNDEYRQICYWNLKEKYLCGGITKDEWKLIAEYMQDVLPIPIL